MLGRGCAEPVLEPSQAVPWSLSCVGLRRLCLFTNSCDAVLNLVPFSQSVWVCGFFARAFVIVCLVCLGSTCVNLHSSAVFVVLAVGLACFCWRSCESLFLYCVDGLRGCCVVFVGVGFSLTAGFSVFVLFVSPFLLRCLLLALGCWGRSLRGWLPVVWVSRGVFFFLEADRCFYRSYCSAQVMCLVSVAIKG